MFHFVANLKPYTFPGPPRFDSYLLSVDFAGGGLRDLAHDCVSKHRLLVADNGNFDRIRVLAKRFEEQAAAAHLLRQAASPSSTPYPRPGTLPTSVVAAYDKLAREVEAAAVVPAEDAAKALAAQRALEPTYVIGPEALAVSTLLAIGVQPEYLSDPYALCARGAAAAIQGARRAQGATTAPAVFAAVHAWDYDSAAKAGAEASKNGLTSIATGLGGALQDRSFVDFRVEHGRVVEFGKPVPRPYLRVVEVAAGLHVGFTHAGGIRPRFHALGAGSPIVLPLLALLGDAGTYTVRAARTTSFLAPPLDGSVRA